MDQTRMGLELIEWGLDDLEGRRFSALEQQLECIIHLPRPGRKVIYVDRITDEPCLWPSPLRAMCRG
jgi:hypothetical protein